MIRINLLPHREAKRKARQQQMIVISAGVAILGVLSVFAGSLVIGTLIDRQEENNRYLKSEIAKLDKDIQEIRSLKEKTQLLLDRKKVVEELQAGRATAVRLLDQMVRQLPPGMYLKAIKQTGQKVNIQGYTQSNARVSTLMRNLEASPWLENPQLVEIKAVTVNNVRANEFSLDVTLSAPQPAGGEPNKDTQAKDKRS
ncbi:PilN domain-containing protein [Thiobacter aerophilum]|uniref:PilN domain-containing protein n=1 Tax=Thiobacter aerophilum TaxID=3121275 RepID=A0ABV0EFH4_9BURK